MNAKRPLYRVDERGAKYTFCPGKATWYHEITKVYQQCFFAYHTGILPREGHFENQSELFGECYPHFVQHFIERRYGRVWRDVNEFTTEVFKTIAKMFSGKKG